MMCPADIEPKPNIFTLGTYGHSWELVQTSGDPVHKFVLTPQWDGTQGYTDTQRCLDSCNSLRWSVHSQWALEFHSVQLWATEGISAKVKWRCLIVFWKNIPGFRHLDIGLEFRSKGRWTNTLVPASPPKYILYCRRKWQWLHRRSTFRSCCHLVESQGPCRKLL